MPMTIAWIGYLALVHLLLGAVLLGHGRSLSPALRARDHALKHSFFQSQMRAFHRRVDEMSRPGSVLFVGDSGIQGVQVCPIRGDALNFGIGGDTTSGVLGRLPGYTSLGEAKAVVLWVGFNDLKISSNSRILENYRKILEIIPEHVPTIVCSILEVDEDIVGHGTNERVNRLNSMIEDLCERNDRTKFLDLNGAIRLKFRGEPGSFLENDGCHLNLDGRRFWLKEVSIALGRIENP